MTESNQSKISGTMVTLVALLCLVGIAISFLTISEHIALKSGLDTGSSFCSINEVVNCKMVLGSSYSELFSIPLGTYGCFFYFLLFFYVLSFPRKKPEYFDALFFMATVSGLVSIALFAVSAILIKGFCPLCLAIYAVNFALVLVCFLLNRSRSLLDRLSNGAQLVLASPLNLVTFWKDVDKQGKKLVFRIFNFALLSFILSYAATPVALLSKTFYMSTDPSRIKESRTIDKDEIKLQADLFSSWPDTPHTPASFDTTDSVSRDLFLGSQDAPIYVTEYIDIECPACRHFYFEFKKILQPFKDKVMLVVKHYPLDSTCNQALTRQVHPYACMAAELSRCGGEQGQYREVFEYLMQYKGFEEGDSAALLLDMLYKELASLGLDETALKACMESDRQLEEVEADVNEGIALGIQGTPAVFVNGRQVPQKQLSQIPLLLKSLVERSYQ